MCSLDVQHLNKLHGFDPLEQKLLKKWNAEFNDVQNSEGLFYFGKKCIDHVMLVKFVHTHVV